MNFGEEEYTKKKERKKFFRVILQIVILAFLGFVLANALFTFRDYVPYQKRSDVPVSTDKGFIALSYFGVTPTGTETLMASDRLYEHLTALRDSGFVTITQQDIIDYYEQGKVLPEKAVFLMFEDGRRDTAVFAQKILEELNYKGTAMTYAERITRKDPNFLKAAELQDLYGNGFWEMGTNGYRLEFINCFDRYDNYLGELTVYKYAMLAPYIGKKFNHYLMDYLRDAYDFPKESYNVMQDRISYDYEKLRDIYKENIGFVPQTYSLMHANTGAFGNNSEVSAVNEKWITELFKINFNREGLSWNNRDSSIYDLTRIQPKPYWHVNHLLMRIAHDQEQSVAFVRGNEQEATKWGHLSGQVEFKDQKIILTTDPNSDGLVVLEEMRPCKDVKVKVNLTGNKYGIQSVYLRTDEDLKDAIGVHISGNNLYVFEDEECLLNLDLNEFEGKEVVSEDEHKKASEVTALAAFARYAPTKAQAEIYGKRMIERQSRSAKSVAEGSKVFVKPIGIHEFGNRKMELCLQDDVLQIKIGDKQVDTLVKVKNTNSGKIALQARMGSLGAEQVIYPDDVYDGVFENLKVTDSVLDKDVEPIIDFNIAGYAIKLYNPWEENDAAVLYDSKLKGFEGFLHDVSVFWDGVLHVFVHGF